MEIFFSEVWLVENEPKQSKVGREKPKNVLPPSCPLHDHFVTAKNLGEKYETTN